MSEFAVNDAVICIDASDIPSPPWHPLTAGATYIVRAVSPIPENGNYDKNVHKRARYLLRLWGIFNMVHPSFKEEFGYADTRFMKIDSVTDFLEEEIQKTKEEVA
jgi:hypothetical protein